MSRSKMTTFASLLVVMLLSAAVAVAPGSAAAPMEDDPPRAAPKDAEKEKPRPPLAGPRREGRRPPPEPAGDDMEDDEGPPPEDDMSAGDDRAGPRRGFDRRPRRDGRRPEGGPDRPGRFGPGGDMPPGRPWTDGGPLPPEAVEDIMHVLAKELPQWHQRLSNLREKNPRRFENGLRLIGPMMREYMMLREHDPELAATVIEEFKIEEELRELSKAYRDAAGDENKLAELNIRVEPLVRKGAELRMQRREARLRMMERRLADERERLADDRARMEEQVRHFIDRIKSGDFEGTLRERMRERMGDRFRERGPRGPDEEGVDGPPRRRPRGDGPQDDRPRRGPRDEGPQGKGPNPDGSTPQEGTRDRI